MDISYFILCFPVYLLPHALFSFPTLKTSLVVFRLGVHRQVRVPIQLPLTREGFLASNSLSSQELVWKASSISNSILHRQELD